MKYAALSRYFEGLAADGKTSAELSMNQVAQVLGRELPPSSRRREWWANTDSHSQAKAWLSAGWKVTRIDMKDHRVRFEKSISQDKPPALDHATKRNPQPSGATERAYPCAHCSNGIPIPATAVIEESIVYGDEPQYQESDNFVWALHVCPTCKKPTLVEYARYHSEMEMNPWPIHRTILYPTEAERIDGLPDAVVVEYRDALRVAKMSANAFAALVGRVLEAVCRDKGASGPSLMKRLMSLEGKGVLPKSIAEIAVTLNVARNIGVHEADGLPMTDVSALSGLMESVLDYVYRIPSRLRVIQGRYHSTRR